MCCRFTSRSRVHLTRMGFSRVFFSLLSEVSWLLLGFKRHYLGFTGFLRSKYVRVWPETAGTCWRVAFFSPTHLLTRLRRKGSEKKKTRWLVIFFWTSLPSIYTSIGTSRCFGFPGWPFYFLHHQVWMSPLRPSFSLNSAEISLVFEEARSRHRDFYSTTSTESFIFGFIFVVFFLCW